MSIRIVFIISGILLVMFFAISCYNKSYILIHEKQAILSLKNQLKKVNANKNDYNIEKQKQKERVKDLQNYSKHLGHSKESLNNQITKLKKEIKRKELFIRQQKEKMEELQVQINNLSNKSQCFLEIYRFESEIRNAQKEINNITHNNNKVVFPYHQSKIILNNHNVNLILKELQYGGKIQLDLLYQSSRDGKTNTSFHLKCDKIQHTLSLLKLNDSIIIGGYTEKTWDGFGYKRDPKAFIFNLITEKIYKVRNEDKAIFANPDYMIIFGFGDIFLTEEKLEIKFPKDYGFMIKENELTGEKDRLYINEIEVYRVNFV